MLADLGRPPSHRRANMAQPHPWIESSDALLGFCPLEIAIELVHKILRLAAQREVRQVAAAKSPPADRPGRVRSDLHGQWLRGLHAVLARSAWRYIPLGPLHAVLGKLCGCADSDRPGDGTSGGSGIFH